MKKKGAFVIAGGSRGLSRVLASKAHAAGYSVAMIARTIQDLRMAKREIESMKGSDELVTIYMADLTDEVQTKAAFKKIISTHKSISVLVNNAATWTGGKSILKLSREDVQRSIDCNFFTAFNSTKALLNLRGKTNSKLTIINMGATSSIQGWDDVFAFCVGKGALRIFSQSLARELQSSGVHVAHIIIDGLIKNTRTLHINPKLKKNRFMNMESIADSLLYLVHQEKSCWTFEIDLRPFNENW